MAAMPNANSTSDPYAILFRVMEAAVRIERVIYGGRDLPNVFDAS